MRKFWKTAIAAAALSGAIATISAPASAQSFGFGFSSGGGVTFSYNSGGYCDSWGCPARFWDLPIYYGPVYFRGAWYQGPVYYRIRFGIREFWIHGGWYRDEWRGSRPAWARNSRLGPALGFEWYDRNGFTLRDEWRRDYYGPNWNRGFNTFPGFGNRPGFDNRRPNQRDEDDRNRPGADNDRNSPPPGRNADLPANNRGNGGAARPQTDRQPPQANTPPQNQGGRTQNDPRDGNPEVQRQFDLGGMGRARYGEQTQTPPPVTQNSRANVQPGPGQRDPRADDMQQMRQRARDNKNN